jgi:glycosyltransferase involved in cell wall biosynthesis
MLYNLTASLKEETVMANPFSVSVVIPAYNEEKTVGAVIANTIKVMDEKGYPYEIIVADDGSTDMTGLIASQCKAKVLTNDKNMGKGYSLRRAFQDAKGEIIVTIDSDGEHKPKEIPDLIEPLLNGTDVVCGSRFLGVSDNFTTKLNQIGNWLFNLAIMLLTGVQVTDSQSGFKALKKDVLNKLNLQSDGYEIETEITVKCLMFGFVFEEKPVSCERRKHNMSKIKILEDGVRILKTIIRSSFDNAY